MAEREEWIRCIRRRKDEAFCGRSIFMEWAFVDFRHAQRAEAGGSRLAPCADCYDLASGVCETEDAGSSGRQGRKETP